MSATLLFVDCSLAEKSKGNDETIGACVCVLCVLYGDTERVVAEINVGRPAGRFYDDE